MLRGLIMTMTLCVTGAMCAPTQAAFVKFAGQFTTVSGTFGSAGGNNAASLVAFFTPGLGPATITSAILKVGSGLGEQTWNLSPVATDLLTVTGAPNDQVNVAIDGNASTSSPGGFSFGGLDLTLNAPGTSGHFNSSDWQTIYDSAAHGQNGSSVGGFVTVGGKTYVFTGAAVPEPGSIALLSGLGLVFGAARRRRNARKSAV